MITVLVAASMTISSHSSLPAWTKATLAGYAVDNDESHRTIAVYDRAKNYYLTRTAECDGADLTVTLTRDRKVVQDAGYTVPGLPVRAGEQDHVLTMRSLSSLKTSMGVAIGDSESQVREIVGKPTKVKDEGSRKQYHALTYEFQTKKRDWSTTYSHRYVFKEGRLIEIQFGRYSG
ncbi:MAG: hypothetical protein WCG75_04835 [Armatimonadota bacterium]